MSLALLPREPRARAQTLGSIAGATDRWVQRCTCPAMLPYEPHQPASPSLQHRQGPLKDRFQLLGAPLVDLKYDQRVVNDATTFLTAFRALGTSGHSSVGAPPPSCCSLDVARSSECGVTTLSRQPDANNSPAASQVNVMVLAIDLSRGDTVGLTGLLTRSPVPLREHKMSDVLSRGTIELTSPPRSREKSGF
jgi:hypothetical protein